MKDFFLSLNPWVRMAIVIVLLAVLIAILNRPPSEERLPPIEETYESFDRETFDRKAFGQKVFDREVRTSKRFLLHPGRFVQEFGKDEGAGRKSEGGRVRGRSRE